MTMSETRTYSDDGELRARLRPARNDHIHRQTCPDPRSIRSPGHSTLRTNTILLTIFTLRHGRNGRGRNEELANSSREAAWERGRDERLLYALVPERRRVDRARVARDRLGELEAEFPYSVRSRE